MTDILYLNKNSSMNDELVGQKVKIIGNFPGLNGKIGTCINQYKNKCVIEIENNDPKCIVIKRENLVPIMNDELIGQKVKIIGNPDWSPSLLKKWSKETGTIISRSCKQFKIKCDSGIIGYFYRKEFVLSMDEHKQKLVLSGNQIKEEVGCKVEIVGGVDWSDLAKEIWVGKIGVITGYDEFYSKFLVNVENKRSTVYLYRDEFHVLN